jgi:hypothetical protein
LIPPRSRCLPALLLVLAGPVACRVKEPPDAARARVSRTVRLPAGLRASLDVQGVKLDLAVTPSALLIAEDRLWYGADLHATRGAAPAPK